MNAIEIERAIALLRREVELTSYRAVAARMGYSAAALNLIVNGKYKHRLDGVAKAVMEMLSKYECPHTGQEITPDACRAICTAKAPTHNPMSMRHWRSCQTCPHGKKFLNNQTNGGKHHVASHIERKRSTPQAAVSAEAGAERARSA